MSRRGAEVTEAGRRRPTQQEFDAFVREQLQGDWAKMENDDPEFMAAMREFLGYGRDDRDAAGGEGTPDLGTVSED